MRICAALPRPGVRPIFVGMVPTSPRSALSLRLTPIALALLGLTSLPTAADSTYPAAQCAALWYGYADHAAVSPVLDTGPATLDIADAFRAVAHRLDDPATDDAFISLQRPLMALLVKAYVAFGSDPDRDIFQRLMQTCDAFAATQPETRALR